MTETNPNTTPPSWLADAAGNWQLDPVGTSIELRAKAMWGLAKVRGRFNALEGSGVVGEDGTVYGTIVFDAKSIDTKNKSATRIFAAATSSRWRGTRPSPTPPPAPSRPTRAS